MITINKLVLVLPLLYLAFNGCYVGETLAALRHRSSSSSSSAAAAAAAATSSVVKVDTNEVNNLAMKQQGDRSVLAVRTNSTDIGAANNLFMRCEETDIGSSGQMLSAEAAQAAELLAKYYRVPDRPKLAASQQQQQTQMSNQKPQQQQQNARPSEQQDTSPPKKIEAEQSKLLPELPRPLNVTVLIISWYPPILKLQWKLNELDESDTARLDFYHHSRTTTRLDNNRTTSSIVVNGSSGSGREPAGPPKPLGPLLEQFDLELAIGRQQRGNQRPEERLLSSSSSPETPAEHTPEAEASSNLMEDLRMRRYLVDKSLSCFQVTYNIINSRFKVTEEYPPYLRSIMLERLLPATEYSLSVAAVYLGGRYRARSDRVQFVSPTDNESRRFKENTYRPIHRYPDERRELRIGLAQVRSEELTIVVIAVVFWIATICLFFNKWGKIRMLEPYQPAYRETSPSPSFVAAHHHPSAHNLPNSAGGTGSCGTGGSGPLAANLVAAAAAAGPTPKLVATASFCGGAGVVPPAGTEAAAASAAETIQPEVGAIVVAAAAAGQPAAAEAPAIFSKCIAGGGRSSDGTLGLTAAGGRKASRSLLLLANKRFESLAAPETNAAASLRRTDTELNYLFQSKALALAKATSMWSRQQQKLRQLQYRNHLPVSLQQQQQQQQQPQQQPDQQLEMLRRTSQALLRQRNPPPPPLTATGSITPVHRHHDLLVQHSPRLVGAPVGGHADALTIAPVGGRTAAEVGAGSVHDAAQQWSRGQFSSSLTSRGQLIRQQQPAVAELRSTKLGTKSLDWNDEINSGGSIDPADHSYEPPVDCPGAEPLVARRSGSHAEHSELQASSSNRMRRLMFITKSHQHHHIATSISSSTLLKTNSASLPSNKINSSSFDQATSSAATTTTAAAQPASARARDASMDAGSSSSLPARGCDLPKHPPEVGLRRSSTVKPAAVRPPMITAAPGEGAPPAVQQHRSSLVEHHILIEPPSPPMHRDLLDPSVLPVGGAIAEEQQSAGSQPSGFFDGSGGSGSIKSQQQASAPAQNRGGPLASENNKLFTQTSASQLQQQQQQQLSAAPEMGGSVAVATDLVIQQQPRMVAAAAAASDKSVSGEPDRSSSRLDYSTATPSVQRRDIPAACPHQARALSSSSSASNIHSSSIEQQPEICLEAPTEEEEGGGCYEGAGSPASGSAAGASGSLLRRRLSNEPFAKLASYQSTASVRRKLAAATAAASLSQHGGGGGAGGAPTWGAQLSQCAAATNRHYNYHLRHQSFCCDCMAAAASRLSPQSSSMGEGPSAAQQPHQRTASLSTRGSSAGPQPPREGWLTNTSGWLACPYDEIGIAPPSGPPSGRESCELEHPADPIDSQAAAMILAEQQQQQSLRPRVSSVFVASPYSRAHRDSFAMLRALSQKKSKSAEDVAYLSSLVLQIWVRDRNPLLQSASQQQLSSSARRLGGSQERQASGGGAIAGSQMMHRRQRPKSSLTVAHI